MGHDHLFWLSNLNWTKKTTINNGTLTHCWCSTEKSPSCCFQLFQNFKHFCIWCPFCCSKFQTTFVFGKITPQTFSWLIMASHWICVAKLNPLRIRFTTSHQPECWSSWWSPPAREWSMTVHGATAVAKCCKSGSHLQELFDLDSDSSWSIVQPR